MLDFDPRGTEEMMQFSNTFGREKIFELTGMPPLYINSLAKILWIKENEPQNYSKIKRWATYEDFILEKMGIYPALSYSLAARTMCFDIRKNQWSGEILSAAGLKKEYFPDAVPSGVVISKLEEKIAKELGFKKTITVCSGGHDMVCAAIGSGLDPSEPEIAVDIVGTIEGIVPVLKEINTGSTMLENKYPCYPGYNSYVSFSVNLTAGCILKWFRDEFSKDIIREAEKENRDVYDLMLAGLTEEKPGDIFFIPNFAGSSNPDFNTEAKGLFYGLSLDSKRNDLMQGLIEGLCFEVRAHIEGFEKAGIKIESLRAVGGGSRSPGWLQLKSNIIAKKITASDISEASAFGAALLAGVGVGAIKEPTVTVKKKTHLEKQYYPAEEIFDDFDKKFKRYLSLKESIKLFEQY
ncbi:L-fuculokinase [Actinomycetota bacterium]